MPVREDLKNRDDLIDEDINFENQNMHKTWPMIKGCGLLVLLLTGFIALSLYVFKTFF